MTADNFIIEPNDVVNVVVPDPAPVGVVVVSVPAPVGVMTVTGPRGPAGSNGRRGSQWFIGVGPPSGIYGAAPDDHFLDVSTGDIYSFF